MKFKPQGVATPADIRKRLDDFLLDCACRGTVHTSFTDFRSHFISWLRIVLESEKIYHAKMNRYGNTNNTRVGLGIDRRRSVDTGSCSADDYKISFAAAIARANGLRTS